MLRPLLLLALPAPAARPGILQPSLSAGLSAGGETIVLSLEKDADILGPKETWQCWRMSTSLEDAIFTPPPYVIANWLSATQMH